MQSVVAHTTTGRCSTQILASPLAIRPHSSSMLSPLSFFHSFFIYFFFFFFLSFFLSFVYSFFLSITEKIKKFETGKLRGFGHHHRPSRHYTDHYPLSLPSSPPHLFPNDANDAIDVTVSPVASGPFTFDCELNLLPYLLKLIELKYAQF